MSATQQLMQRIQQCRLCEPHLPCGARPVLQFSSQSRILIAGQAPGRKVHETGLPFNDASGVRLREWLGVTASQFYNPEMFAIVPMGFCYPGTGKSGDLPPRPECAAQWRQQTLAALPNIQLTLVIGQYAMTYHLPAARGTLTDTVGNWQQYWPELLPLPHPSPRNNIWLKRNPWFEEQLLPPLQKRVEEIISGTLF